MSDPSPRDTTRQLNSPDARKTLFALGSLAEGALLCDRFVVVRTFRPHETARPGVFLCDDAQLGRVVVKIHPLDIPPDQHLWSMLQQIRHPSVVPILHTLHWQGLWVEVQPYLSGGSLVDRYTQSLTGLVQMPLPYIENGLVPQISSALAALHERGIVHRDVKPGNILIQPEEGGDHYLLGDYDISSQLAIDVHTRLTSRAAGTWIYTAPEAFPRYRDDNGELGAKVSRASDYYSLGVSLLELCVGTTPLHTSQLPDMYDFYLTGNRLDPPASIPQRVRELISGLLIRQPHLRWGEPELSRWLRHGTTAEDLTRIEQAQHQPVSGKVVVEFRYYDQIVESPEHLGQLMAGELDKAAFYLEQPEGLWSWLGQIDVNRAVTVRKRFEAARSAGGAEMLLVCLSNPSARCLVNGDVLQNAAQWLENHKQQARASWVTDMELNRLLYWLEFHRDGDPALAERLKPIKKTPHSVRLFEMQWALFPELPITIRPGYTAQTPAEFALIAYGKEPDWASGRCESYQRAMVVWQDGLLEAWLRQRGLLQLSERSEQIRQQSSDQPIIAFEELLLQLNPELPKPVIRVDHASTVQISFATSTPILVPYHTKGMGNPIIQVKWRAQPELVPAPNPLVGREGHISAVFGAQMGRARASGEMAFSLSSHNAIVSQELHTVPFRVVNPNGDLIRQMIISILVGIAIFWFSRWVMSVTGLHAPFTYEQLEVNGTWRPYRRAATNTMLSAQLGIAVWASLMSIGWLCHQSARMRVERLAIGDPSMRDLINREVMGSIVAFIGISGFVGPWMAYILDILTSSRLTSSHPALMWAVWGGVLGGVAGFWLISPVQGRTYWRGWVLLAVIIVMVVLAAVTMIMMPDVAVPVAATGLD